MAMQASGIAIVAGLQNSCCIFDNPVVMCSAMSHAALLRALSAVDNNQSEFARRVGCTQQIVSYWLANECAIAPQFVLAAERETGVPRHDLRPDIYPHESAAA